MAVSGAAGGGGRRIVSIVDLNLSPEPIALPIAFESLYAAVLGDRLHLFGLDEVRRACHLTIEGPGTAVGMAQELPLAEVTGATACAGALIVAGVADADRPVVLRLGPGGKVAWCAEIPAGTPLQHWPRPVCAAGATWLFSTTGGTPSVMRLVQADGDRLGEPVPLACADDTDTVDVLGDAAGVVVARVHAGDRRLELVRIAGGRAAARREVDGAHPAAGPSVALVGDRVALAWITEPGSPRLQWFDGRLEPLGAPEVLATPLRPGAVRSVRLLAAQDGALAVVFRSQEIVGDGGTVHQPDGTVVRREPRRTAPAHLAAYDTSAHRLGPLHLIDADAKLLAGGWLGRRLVIAHRGGSTRVSIYARDAQG